MEGAQSKPRAGGDSPNGELPPAIALSGINKHFGPVHANKDVSLTVPTGTIHGIIGENGAGKSTLMSILYGFYQADSGEIRVNGEPRVIPDLGRSDRLRDWHGAPAFHVGGSVHGAGKCHARQRGAAPSSPAAWARPMPSLSDWSSEYSLEVDPDALISDLPVGLQQRVEILKALHRGAEILILDEPTGVLTPQEADQLFRILATLREQGKTIILITHKLREIMAITDNVTVMRRGEVVANVATADTDQEKLAELMVGRTVLLRVDKKPAEPKQTVLEVRHLDVIDRLGVRRVKDVSLSVRAGEIVGIAGVSGNGQSELLAALSGMVHASKGEVLINGTDIRSVGATDAKDMRDLGMGHVPEDRLHDGLVRTFAANENSILGYHDDPAYNGRILMDRHAIIDLCGRYMQDFDVRPPNAMLKAANFSGGNQQKLIVAREMERDPALLLVGQPTRGVDIGAIEFIHRRLVEMRDAGKAVLLVSVELDEILSLSDRILVMFDGYIVGEVSTGGRQ